MRFGVILECWIGRRFGGKRASGKELWMGVGFENKFAWHDRPCAGWSVCVLSLCLALQTCVVADEDDDDE